MSIPDSPFPIPAGATRILGIDPGSQRTGLGVIDVGADGRCTFVHARALKLLDADDFPSRLGLLCEGLEAALDEFQPQQVAIETVFMDKSATSALKLGHARGAALATVVRRRIPISEYAPRVIKQSLVGRGAADKQQVQHMVRLLLNIPEVKLQADAADALAVALTHAHMSATARRTGISTLDLRRRGT
ncbi:crossover junction endodeoxyribonuclease RuvC [Lysobacter capsici]|jgi:crossover junction endodeoxyribonuclease RuvC|uniref:Crossover junction endodeoxyribonuclease RuvC n=1 Tax=Lysobacter capsici AZ78 TaxID=1444315 RepID=A0A120AHV6_9GAMM|nr:crossover junction endodeoxyribonuclease RuvC [Lysobacter capsici]ALN87451.1 crossover junction endodeoxyribonuclease RuvC [Lysobacter capsici]KWS06773.1 Crossover junction endodeoxyribonuclease RuvC [Lysobacter capsici AZ78]UOF13858.1 crossover junction endodeoxyribonuclease RuvC [Lysobacter capsici]WND79453.1 crossover junction endodeoxyribonuclease RuvC [Lysobacter capsici]WND84649.1 crossover junction endodeoxyribonuclease RuvC [Lysobacter capsici]